MTEAARTLAVREAIANLRKQLSGKTIQVAVLIRELDALDELLRSSLPGTREEVARDGEAAKALLTEIIAFFSTTQDGLGDGWAHPDDYTSYGLDYRHRNGTQLWLDLEDDGTIHVLWKPAGQDKPTIMYFSALSPAPMPEREGMRELAQKTAERLTPHGLKLRGIACVSPNRMKSIKPVDIIEQALRAALASHDDKEGE